MNDADRALRRTLRAKARQLGDPLERNADDPMPALERELAYERWHQMLFAAFLAHNDLLIHPTAEVAVTLDDCEELAAHEGDADAWHTAARYASHMLPGIFKPQDPLLQVRFAPEDHQALERVLGDIPLPTYNSDDGLGWVYQFWQTKRKKQVNASGAKIGGADISPVTQLFTEHYMVQFLLHNTLGAWWVSRHPDKALPTDQSYLRTLDDGTPAAGTFEGWPEQARDITVLDPCCGSGHFLVAAFALMKRFRMIEEGLSEAEAGDAVIRDNLHGLELDPRCTQIAAFNLALEAWKTGGYRELPQMNIACSGISVGGEESEWTALAKGAPKAERALNRLYRMFKDAPDLGSLIDPTRLAEHDPLYTASFHEVEELLNEALKREKSQDDPVTAVFGDAAKGITRAAELLRDTYTLVVTNVPYLTRGKQNDTLKNHIERVYALGKADLATAFVERCRDFTSTRGSYALVTPQNWLFLGSYKKLRERLLESQSWNAVARLGTGAFETIAGEVVNVALFLFTQDRPAADQAMAALDVSEETILEEKRRALAKGRIGVIKQAEQLRNPESIVKLERQDRGPLLNQFATAYKGITTGDDPRFKRYFWEVPHPVSGWYLTQGTVKQTRLFGGCEYAMNIDALSRSDVPGSYIRGRKRGESRALPLAKWGIYLYRCRWVCPAIRMRP